MVQSTRGGINYVNQVNYTTKMLDILHDCNYAILKALSLFLSVL